MPGADAGIVGGATRVLGDVLVPDDARKVDQDPVLRPVEEPFRVAQLNHAVVQTRQVGVDVIRFARGAFHRVVARAKVRGGLDDAVPRVDRPARVAPAASGVAIIKVTKRLAQLGTARGVDLARRVIERAGVDVDRGGLEAQLEFVQSILLVIQSGVEIRLRRCRGSACEDIQRERERKSHFLPTRSPNSRKLPQPTPPTRKLY